MLMISALDRESLASAFQRHQAVGLRDREVELGRLEGLLPSDATHVTNKARLRFALFSGCNCLVFFFFLGVVGRGPEGGSRARAAEVRGWCSRVQSQIELVLGALGEGAQFGGINNDRMVDSLS